MEKLPYTLEADDPTQLPMGLVVLESDETIEGEFRQIFADFPNPLYVTRITSSTEVTPKTLGAMEGHLSQASNLLPKARPYSVIGYACTSGSAVIGSETVEQLVRSACPVTQVTNPLRAAIAFANHHGVSRLAVLSPYVEEVNTPVLNAFEAAGLRISHFTSFAEKIEEKVVRISHASIMQAAKDLRQRDNVDGVFISCTNLRTLKVISDLTPDPPVPVFSSNSALAWHMRQFASA